MGFVAGTVSGLSYILGCYIAGWGGGGGPQKSIDKTRGGRKKITPPTILKPHLHTHNVHLHFITMTTAVV